MRLSANLHLKTALSKCIIYDTIGVHGIYKTINSFDSIISENELSDEELVSKVEEKWIRNLLKHRQNVLEDSNRTAIIGWTESMDRVDGLIDLIDQNNWNLSAPIHLDSQENTIEIL